MASYARLKKQLEDLQVQVESARQAELLPIIKRMQREMANHGISAADLGGTADHTNGAVKKSAGKKSVKGAGAPKYREPKSGLTWSGFGRAPGWIAGARDRTKFLIDGRRDPGAPAPVSAKRVAKEKLESKVASKKSSGRVSKKVAKAAKKTSGPQRAGAKKARKGGGSRSSRETSIQAQTANAAQPLA